MIDDDKIKKLREEHEALFEELGKVVGEDPVVAEEVFSELSETISRSSYRIKTRSMPSYDGLVSEKDKTPKKTPQVLQQPTPSTAREPVDGVVRDVSYERQDPEIRESVTPERPILDQKLADFVERENPDYNNLITSRKSAEPPSKIDIPDSKFTSKDDEDLTEFVKSSMEKWERERERPPSRPGRTPDAPLELPEYDSMVLPDIAPISKIDPVLKGYTTQVKSSFSDVHYMLKTIVDIVTQHSRDINMLTDRLTRSRIP